MNKVEDRFAEKLGLQNRNVYGSKKVDDSTNKNQTKVGDAMSKKVVSKKGDGQSDVKNKSALAVAVATVEKQQEVVVAK